MEGASAFAVFKYQCLDYLFGLSIYLFPVIVVLPWLCAFVCFAQEQQVLEFLSVVQVEVCKLDSSRTVAGKL